MKDYFRVNERRSRACTDMTECTKKTTSYLLDLLNNHKRYEAKIEVLKSHQCLFHDQDEYERYMKIEQDLLHMRCCIDKLMPVSRETIVNLYMKGFSLKDLGKVMHLTKSGVYNRKEVALRELKALFA